MENVTDQTPGREPDNVTPEQAALEREIVGLDDADDFFVIGALPADEQATLDAAYREDRNRGNMAADEQRTGDPTPAPAEPERRTVSLEVLTDQLRADEDDRRREAAHEASKMRVDGEIEKPILLAAAARVGIVLRLDGEAVLVPETDGMWLASFRQPADVLEALLRQARNYADDHDDAELLMPTPDVLAALAGAPDARLLTVPVHVLAMDVQAGMLLYATDDDGDGAEMLELVSAVKDCADPECINGALCVVLAVEGHEDPDVHFNGYARIEVRIPAAVTR